MAEHRAHQLAGHSRKPRTPDGPRLLKSSESNESRSSNAFRQKTVADVCERRQSPQAVRMGSPGGGLVVGAAAVLGRMGCTPRFRRSTGFAEAVWAGDAGRPLVEQRYSHFRPRADLRLAREQSFNAELPGAARPCRAASGDQNGASLSAALGAFWRGQIECMFYEATTVDAKLNDGWE